MVLLGSQAGKSGEVAWVSGVLGSGAMVTGSRFQVVVQVLALAQQLGPVAPSH